MQCHGRGVRGKGGGSGVRATNEFPSTDDDLDARYVVPVFINGRIDLSLLRLLCTYFTCR